MKVMIKRRKDEYTGDDTVVVSKHPAAETGDESQEVDSVVVDFFWGGTPFGGSTEAHCEKDMWGLGWWSKVMERSFNARLMRTNE